MHLVTAACLRPQGPNHAHHMPKHMPEQVLHQFQAVPANYKETGPCNKLLSYCFLQTLVSLVPQKLKDIKAQSGTEIDFTVIFKGPRRDQDMGRGRRLSFDQVRRRIIDPVKSVL